MKKRILSILLVCCMVLTLLPGDRVCGGGRDRRTCIEPGRSVRTPPGA